ncbi:LIM and senescent cell antigen-like-containing domain protein 1 isoform X1 [Ixodes scapularis]
MSGNRLPGDSTRGRREHMTWQMDSSPLYLRRQDHLNDRMRGLYLAEQPPPVTFSTPPPRVTRSLRSPDATNSSDYDNTPPEPPKRTSSSSMTPSYDSVSTSSSSLQYRNGGFGGAGSSTARSNEGLYSSPGTSGIVLEETEEQPEANFLMSLETMACTRCGDGFEPHEKIVNSHGEVWHQACFVCCQCFRPFPDGIFYEFEGRKYCEHDFHVLFAPCCGKCGEFIIGRVIKAMNNNWHPNCFRCEICQMTLADQGFIKNAGRALCHECNAKEKAAAIGKYICYKCHGIVDDLPLKFRGEPYHPYHFNCTTCGVELTSEAREVKGDLYCLRCHDKMGIPICGACRRPIEERVVTALGKNWHVELPHSHFVKVVSRIFPFALRSTLTTVLSGASSFHPSQSKSATSAAASLAVVVSATSAASSLLRFEMQDDIALLREVHVTDGLEDAGRCHTKLHSCSVDAVQKWLTGREAGKGNRVKKTDTPLVVPTALDDEGHSG